MSSSRRDHDAAPPPSKYFHDLETQKNRRTLQTGNAQSAAAQSETSRKMSATGLRKNFPGFQQLPPLVRASLDEGVQGGEKKLTFSKQKADF
jgi:hypothetical protein